MAGPRSGYHQWRRAMLHQEQLKARAERVRKQQDELLKLQIEAERLKIEALKQTLREGNEDEQ